MGRITNKVRHYCPKCKMNRPVFDISPITNNKVCPICGTELSKKVFDI